MTEECRGITLHAPAKINLFLEVTGKRPDGYHDIESVMMAAEGLYDTVTLKSTSDEKISLVCLTDTCKRPGDIGEVSERDNLAFRAAEMFFERLRQKGDKNTFGVEIKIEKRIPVRAGLGGGSADAGAVLRGLNSLFGNVFTVDELCEIGLRLGADVPFCTSGEKCALCLGVGEKMTFIENKVPIHGIITAEKGEKPSTGYAYGKIDSAGERVIKSADALVTSLKDGDRKKALSELYNIFEKVCDYGSSAREILRKTGATAVLLSGAGPSVFAVFDSEEKERKASLELESEGFAVYKF